MEIIIYYNLPNNELNESVEMTFKFFMPFTEGKISLLRNISPEYSRENILTIVCGL